MRRFVSPVLVALAAMLIASTGALSAPVDDPFEPCKSAADGTSCDDGAACTTGSVCQRGACVSRSPTCRNYSDAQDRSYCSLETGACVSVTEPCAPFFPQPNGQPNRCLPNYGIDAATGECLYDPTPAQSCVPPGCFDARCNPDTGGCEPDLDSPRTQQCGTDDFCQPRPDCVHRTCFYESCTPIGSPANCDTITNLVCEIRPTGGLSQPFNPSWCQVSPPNGGPNGTINGCSESRGCANYQIAECAAPNPCETLVRDPNHVVIGEIDGHERVLEQCCTYEPRDCAAEFGNAPNFDYACEVVGTQGVCRATPNTRSLAAKVTVVKPGEVFKFVAKGRFTLPDPSTENPAVEGATLTFNGTTGGQTYQLPAAGWKGLGPHRDGSKGFKFKDAVCDVVVKRTVVKGGCKKDTGDFGPLPESGPVHVTLAIGSGTHYCVECGGKTVGNPAKIFKRSDCALPAACP